MDEQLNNTPEQNTSAPAPETYAPNQNDPFAIASLALGILSIILAFVYTPIGLILGIVGIVLGAKARKEAPSGMATGGFVCSIIGTVICAALLVCVVCGVALFGVAVSSMDPEELADIVEISETSAGFFSLL